MADRQPDGVSKRPPAPMRRSMERVKPAIVLATLDETDDADETEVSLIAQADAHADAQGKDGHAAPPDEALRDSGCSLPSKVDADPGHTTASPDMLPATPVRRLRRVPSNRSGHSCLSIRYLGLDPSACAVEVQRRVDNLIVVADVPTDQTVGCDLMTPRFHLKQAQAFYHPFHGLHFAWVARYPTDRCRSGFFFFTKPSHNGSIRVLQWNRYTQTLGTHGVKVLENEIIVCAHTTLPKLTRESLSPEDWEKGRIWALMTSHITPAVLNKITLKSAAEWRVQSNDPIRDANDPNLNLLGIDRDLYVPFSNSELSFRFAKLTCAAHDKVAVPASDTTDLIDTFLTTHTDFTTDDLIAEFQILFIAGNVAENPLCYELWWKMARAVALHSFSLPEKRPTLAHSLLVTLGNQLAYHDHINSSTSRLSSIRNSLREAIVVYKMRLTDTCLLPKCQTAVHASLANAFSEIENWAGKKFGDELRGQYVKVQNLDGAKSSERTAVGGSAAALGRDFDEEMVPFPVHTAVPKKKKGLFRWW